MPESKSEFDHKITWNVGANNWLNVEFQTENLSLKSATLLHLNDYAKLLIGVQGSKAEAVVTRLNVWVERWQKHDPFSSLAVSEKNGSKKFIGHVVIGYAQGNPGRAELVSVFDNKYRGKGYEQEAVVAVVTRYVREIIEKGYKMEGNIEFNRVVTTVNDDEEDFKIPIAAGMRKLSEETEPGRKRCTFFVDASELVKQPSSSKLSDIPSKENLTEVGNNGQDNQLQYKKT